MTYSPLLRSVFGAPNDTLYEVVVAHLENNQDPNASSSYGETPLRQAFRRGRMDVVSLLVKRGATINQMNWGPLHRAVALGSIEDVEELHSKSDLSERDRAGLTPFLLACDIGDVAKTTMLFEVTSKSNMLADYQQEPAIVIAARKNRLPLVEWLLSNGFDVDEAAEFGLTALIAAASADALDVVAALLNAGANINSRNDLAGLGINQLADEDIDQDSEHCMTAGSETLSGAVARLMMDAGVPVAEFGPEALRELTGNKHIERRHITREIFAKQQHRRFGTENPEVVVYEYWLEAIRGQAGGHYGRQAFGVPPTALPAIWSYDRFGMSTTELPDGRWVQIAGEHEDSYDPDFCIYSDVFVFDGKGNVEINIYPRDVFPPTDFHTATLYNDSIIMIGSLGYLEDRQIGETQVMCLNIENFSISNMGTSGDNPGWISRHSARLEGDKIIVKGGKIWNGSALVPNKERFELCLNSRIWKKLS